MSKFKIRIKDPVFDAIKVDEEFLDNLPKNTHFWKSGDSVYCEETKVHLGDWIIFVETESGDLLPEVTTDKAFHMFYEVVEESA